MFWGAVLTLLFETCCAVFPSNFCSGIVLDKTLGWRLKAGTYYVLKFQPHRKLKKISINKRGFNDINHAVIKDSKTTRIMFLGDSYTAAFRWDPVFNAVTVKAIHDDRRNRDTTYEIMNVAVSAWGTDQQLLYLADEGMLYEPEIVFLMLAPNDIRESACKRFFFLDENGVLKKNRIEQPSFIERCCWILSNHSCGYNFLQKHIFKTNYGSFEKLFTYYPVFFKDGDLSADHLLFKMDIPDEVAEARKLFESLLDRMHRLCCAHKTRLVIVMLPTKVEFSGVFDEKTHSSGLIARYVKRIAEQKGIDFLDLYTLASQENNPLEIFEFFGYHYSNYGFQYLSQQISQYCIKHREWFL